MRPKSIIFALIVILGAGLAVYFIVKSRSGASAADDGGNTATVISVKTGTLQRVTLHHYVTGYGTVMPAPTTAGAPAAAAPLAAPSAGVVAAVNVVEGQHVNRGDVLMSFNSGTMTVENAAQQLERQKQLYAQQNTSLKNLQDAEAQLALLEVAAPLSGTVVHVNVRPGQAVDLTTVVAEVMDLNRLVVETGIPESEAGDLKPGQEVQVVTQPPVTAQLSFVSPAMDTSSGTVLVRARLPADSGLRPGQFVPLQIVTAVHANCLAAPVESVVTDENGQSSISLINGDEATKMPVQIGFHENGWTEIEAAGLKPGDTVVTVGVYGLPDKTQIRVVNSSEDETSMTNPASPRAQ